VTQRAIAEQNFTKARELTITGDYYGAIVLLKQAVDYEPEHLDAWLTWASRSRLKPFIKLARTIRRHRDGILNASA